MPQEKIVMIILFLQKVATKFLSVKTAFLSFQVCSATKEYLFFFPEKVEVLNVSFTFHVYIKHFFL